VTFQKQLKMGILPAYAELTARPDAIPSWNSTTDEEKKVYTRMMEVMLLSMTSWMGS